MVIALAGRRIDASDTEASHFPISMKGAVRQRLLDFFRQHGATALVCSGACGADLLALDAAGELGLHRRMVLPFDRASFRHTSVTDRSDPEWWGALFDDIADALEPEDLVVLDEHDQGSQAYLATNEAILDEAVKLARGSSEEDASSEGGDILALLVWDGAPRQNQKKDITFAFEQSARQRGIDVEYTSTLQQPTRRPPDVQEDQ